MVEYRESLLKTFIPLLLGCIAGILSFIISGEIRKRDPLGIIILVFLIYLNKFILPRLRVSLESKDWALIGFMTFSSWYITWTILLNY